MALTPGSWIPLVFLVAAACRETSSTSASTQSPLWSPIAPGIGELRTVRHDSRGADITWTVIRIDLALATVRAEHTADDRLDSLAALPQSLFAVNAGFFEPDGSPSGLIVQEGHIVSPWRRGAGSGVLVVLGQSATIVAMAPESPDGVSLALQCGPRLVEPGGVIGVHGDDGKRAARTVACVRRQGHELDLVLAYDASTPMGGPTLLETARWLVQPLVLGDSGGCETALNLDGGPSTGFVSRALPDSEWKRPAGPVPWGIVGAQR